MVVRVAQRAMQSAALRTVVATDSQEIIERCASFGVTAVLTRVDHPSGSDRLAEACGVLGLADEDIVVNVQGDEPLIDPALINAVARLLNERPDCAMSTAAHSIGQLADLQNPNVVKVVLDARHTRSISAAHRSRRAATSPARPGGRPAARCPSRCGTSASTATAWGFCGSSPPSPGAAGAARATGATARPVARPPHRRAHHRRRARPGRGHRRRPGPRPQAVFLSTPSRAGKPLPVRCCQGCMLSLGKTQVEGLQDALAALHTCPKQAQRVPARRPGLGFTNS